jgi:hypothetical protein
MENWPENDCSTTTFTLRSPKSVTLFSLFADQDHRLSESIVRRLQEGTTRGHW